jgi:hypothetical protein
MASTQEQLGALSDAFHTLSEVLEDEVDALRRESEARWEALERRLDERHAALAERLDAADAARAAEKGSADANVLARVDKVEQASTQVGERCGQLAEEVGVVQANARASMCAAGTAGEQAGLRGAALQASVDKLAAELCDTAERFDGELAQLDKRLAGALQQQQHHHQQEQAALQQQAMQWQQSQQQAAQQQAAQQQAAQQQAAQQQAAQQQAAEQDVAQRVAWQRAHERRAAEQEEHAASSRVAQTASLEHMQRSLQKSVEAAQEEVQRVALQQRELQRAHGGGVAELHAQLAEVQRNATRAASALAADVATLAAAAEEQQHHHEKSMDALAAKLQRAVERNSKALRRMQRNAEAGGN